MNTYRVKVIIYPKERTYTTEEYREAVKKATVHYCKGLKELTAFCGGRLHRERNGYAGINGRVEYVAERI